MYERKLTRSPRRAVERPLSGAGSRRDWLALSNVIFMSLLIVQFGTGMGVKLYGGGTVAPQRPGEFVLTASFENIRWVIVHGRLTLALHALLGFAVLVGALHNVVQSVRWGPRGSVWASAVGAVFVVAAGINGVVLLNHYLVLNSLLMALCFGAAMLCYAVSLYVLTRPARTTAVAS